MEQAQEAKAEVKALNKLIAALTSLNSTNYLESKDNGNRSGAEPARGTRGYNW